MEVKFKHINGLQPYFEHDGKYFYINQTKEDGEYKYQLKVSWEWEKHKYSKDPQRVISRFLRNKKYESVTIGCNVKGFIYDGLMITIYCMERKIKIQKEPVVLSRSFKSQQECIEFSKKYIQEKHLDKQVGFLETMVKL